MSSILKGPDARSATTRKLDPKEKVRPSEPSTGLDASAIKSVVQHLEKMPMPKKFALAQKKKAREEAKAQATAAAEAAAAAGVDPPKKKKKKKENKERYPMPDPLPPAMPLSVVDTMSEARGWNNRNVISNKFSAGNATTSTYDDRVTNFTRLNTIVEERAALYPPQNYFGKTPEENKDRFDKRTVRQLNDISFEEEEDWEEVANLDRMPQTILNEENLKKCLSQETLRLNLENHYWLKNNMIDKIGQMAPNLRVISFRRMKFISNPTFALIFKYLKQLERVDLCDCDGLLPSAACLAIDNNKESLAEIQLSGCTGAVDDKVLSLVAGLEKTLTFLDISYCKQVTDAGLPHFADKKYPLETLVINGVTGISGAALNIWLKSFSATLAEFEASLMDQETFTHHYFESLGQCWNLELIDLTGSRAINDECGKLITAGEITYEKQTFKPGLQYMKTLKICGAELTDITLIQITKIMPELEHLELTKCEKLTEFSLNSCLETNKNLTFMDLNGIPVVTYAYMHELSTKYPSLRLKRHKYQEQDFKKDNMLRVPRKIIQKKKAKGKKKKKK